MRASAQGIRTRAWRWVREAMLQNQDASVRESTHPLRVLLVKTSSLGDVVANLPVVVDILRWRPDAGIDWVVEEAFADVVRMHPRVANVIVVAQRRWRKRPLSAVSVDERRMFHAQIRARSYDLVVDTQGLLKSAIIAFRARGPSVGYGWSSAREPLATLAYDRRISVPKTIHAMERNRRLVAGALGYALGEPADYGLRCPTAPTLDPPNPFWVALHGTSRDEKLWPEACWMALGASLSTRGFTAVLPWGTERERARSERLAAAIPGALAPPRLGLQDLAGFLGAARFVVGVDTGLTHLAAALRVPVVALFCDSDPALSGVRGEGTLANLGGPNNAPDAPAVTRAVDALISQGGRLRRLGELAAMAPRPGANGRPRDFEITADSERER
jgi:lipopolysaccharide heptosyltransferase I